MLPWNPPLFQLQYHPPFLLSFHKIHQSPLLMKTKDKNLHTITLKRRRTLSGALQQPLKMISVVRYSPAKWLSKLIWKQLGGHSLLLQKGFIRAADLEHQSPPAHPDKKQ
jgi:hypothetical protein